MKTFFTRRKVFAVLAAVTAAATMITGSWAWWDSSQHKTNEMEGNKTVARQDVVLAEDFEEPDDWEPGQELTKKISAKNTGEGSLFVRIQLKEFMERSHIEYAYTAERLATDEDGSFIAGATEADLKAWLDSRNVNYSDGDIKQYQAYGDADTKYYLATNANTNIHGRDGKFMMLSYTEGAPESLVPGVVRSAYTNTDDHVLHPTGECLYTPHLWSDAGIAADPFHEFVQWNMGSPLVKLSDWDGKPAAVWILDDTSAEGWVYWGQAIAPGSSTAQLLNSVTLLARPGDGKFYYALHVDMIAADKYDLTAKFTGMPADIKEALLGSL
ncbi:MAG: BsaA family SipW-dependent biofilm matrix protein [Oscillospiraceae bacterium]|jgi:hypothetical protein|nr:BsaA family SipW-dependent biofilm matrix protein [Oscillospiraceae bacterium]